MRQFSNIGLARRRMAGHSRRTPGRYSAHDLAQQAARPHLAGYEGVHIVLHLIANLRCVLMIAKTRKARSVLT